MRLKPTIKGMKHLVQEEKKEEKVVAPKEKTTTKKTSKNTLPKDEYHPMFEPIRFLVKETASYKDPTKVVKQYLELSVKRFNDDEALPHAWIQMYQESEFYTGYLSGKSVYLPLEMMYDLIDNLTELSEECDRRKIE